MSKKITFIDLFAGIGGFHLALHQLGAECVFASEIDNFARKTYQTNFQKVNSLLFESGNYNTDIRNINPYNIPDFDILCAGFPCQPFSQAGLKRGFNDLHNSERGNLFFYIAEILQEKRPKAFFLENVQGLLKHDNGKTFQTIISSLEAIGYKVNYEVLNSKYFGVAQERKRIYIVGTFNKKVELNNFPKQQKVLNEILSSGLPTMQSDFTKLLLSKYKVSDLYGKSIKDKRGGENNIHSWDIGIKGEVSDDEKILLNLILTERRKKKWAEIYGIDWMDGMPLTREMIASFYENKNLDVFLESLVKKGYLVKEHPKRKVFIKENNKIISSYREQDTSLPKGYNIVTGKLSFEINNILDLNSVAPTLVAMDVGKIAVADSNGLRRLTLREGLRLFGYPEDYKFDVSEKEGFDLLGNTVVIPVIKAVCKRLLNSI